MEDYRHIFYPRVFLSSAPVGKRLEENQVKEQLSRDAATVVASFDPIRCSGTPRLLWVVMSGG